MGNKTETKNERFVRVAEARTNKILDMIQLLGNCANRNTYEYTDDEVKKIFNAIENELKLARMRFESKGNDKKKEKFTLR